MWRPTFNFDGGCWGGLAVLVYSLDGVDADVVGADRVNVQGDESKLVGGLDARS